MKSYQNSVIITVAMALSTVKSLPPFRKATSVHTPASLEPSIPSSLMDWRDIESGGTMSMRFRRLLRF